MGDRPRPTGPEPTGRPGSARWPWNPPSGSRRRTSPPLWFQRGRDDDEFHCNSQDRRQAFRPNTVQIRTRPTHDLLSHYTAAPRLCPAPPCRRSDVRAYYDRGYGRPPRGVAFLPSDNPLPGSCRDGSCERNIWPRRASIRLRMDGVESAERENSELLRLTRDPLASNLLFIGSFAPRPILNRCAPKGADE